jgi:hypothetical protein
MTNVKYQNLTKKEADQMAFELQVEGKFEFEVKEEGGAWSVHFWSKDEAPAGTAAPKAAGPAAPAAAPAPVGPASPRATPEQSPMAPTLFCPPEGWSLGTLSSQYETSGRGPGTVSSGKDDPGGVSYGSYQMTSSGGGTVRKFVSDAAFPWRDRFAGLTPGSEQFSAQWKTLANEEPDAFFKAQHAFIEKTHFAPLVQNIKSACGFDVAQRSHALQDAVWSTAVQHGPNTPVITIAIKAVGGVDALPPSDLDGERRLIRAIYAERGRKSADGGLAYFPRVRDKLTQQSLAERFVNEARDALAMLDHDA